MPKFFLSMLCTSKIHLISLQNRLGTSLVNGNLMRIRNTSVQMTKSKLEWPLA